MNRQWIVLSKNDEMQYLTRAPANEEHNVTDVGDEDTVSYNSNFATRKKGNERKSGYEIEPFALGPILAVIFFFY